MPRFFRRLAEGIFDEEDVIRRANELADFIGSAATRYDFDPNQITAVGYSNGANIAAAVLLLRPGTILSAVLFRAMVPLVPAELADLQGTRGLICSGRRDPIIPLENAQRLMTMFRESGAEVALRVQDASHQLMFEEVEAAKKWLRDSPSIR